MYLSRRRFIRTSGTLFLGSGFLLHASCRKRTAGELKPLVLDYVGPAGRYMDISSLFSGIQELEIRKSSIEQAVSGDAQLSFLCTSGRSRAAVAVLLLEQGKDVLLLPPLAQSFEEFDTIQQTCNRYNCRLALLNPLHHLDAVAELRKLVREGTAGSIIQAELVMHPGYSYPLIPAVEGILGAGIFHVQLVNELSSSWPQRVVVKEPAVDRPGAGVTTLSLEFDYGNMALSFCTASSVPGWELRITADNGSYLLDHSGMLQAGEQEVLVRGERNALTESIKKSVNDYIDSVRTLKEPESNAVEGMMQLAMNTAASLSVQTGSPVELNKVYDTV